MRFIITTPSKAQPTTLQEEALYKENEDIKVVSVITSSCAQSYHISSTQLCDWTVVFVPVYLHQTVIQLLLQSCLLQDDAWRFALFQILSGRAAVLQETSLVALQVNSQD